MNLEEALDAGFSVTRWHTVSTLKPQNLAAHSWGVAMIISRLFNGDTEDLILLLKVALEHDLIEKYTGDTPRQYKTEEQADQESILANAHGLANESWLSPHLLVWLKAADLLEAGMHAQREIRHGNRNYLEILNRVRSISKDDWPKRLREFAASQTLLEIPK